MDFTRKKIPSKTSSIGFTPFAQITSLLPFSPFTPPAQKTPFGLNNPKGVFYGYRVFRVKTLYL